MICIGIYMGGVKICAIKDTNVRLQIQAYE